MTTATVLTLIPIVAILVIAGLAWKLFRSRRTRKLRSQFGLEYDRTIEQYGGAAKAERDLETRQKRVEKANIRSLTPIEREQFADRWQTVQSRFVDVPAGTIRDADSLVVEIMLARGYPMVEFEGRRPLTTSVADTFHSAGMFEAHSTLCQRTYVPLSPERLAPSFSDRRLAC
jgi:hypothetical protein